MTAKRGTTIGQLSSEQQQKLEQLRRSRDRNRVGAPARPLLIVAPRDGELEASFGISRDLNKHWSMGLELRDHACVGMVPWR